MNDIYNYMLMIPYSGMFWLDIGLVQPEWPEAEGHYCCPGQSCNISTSNY